MSGSGFYNMHRGWMDDALFKKEKYSRREAWCWLIENANFKDKKEFIAGHPVTVKRGSMVYTERQLAKIWKWGRQQVRTFLKHLQVDEKIVVNLTQQITQISIVNYSTYQDKQPKNKPTSNPAVTHEQPSLEEGKEGKEIKHTKEFELFFAEYPNKQDKHAASKNFTKEKKFTTAENLIACAKVYAKYISDNEKQDFAFKAKNWIRNKTYLDYQPEDGNRKAWEKKLEYFKKGQWIEEWGSKPSCNGWKQSNHGECPNDLEIQFLAVVGFGSNEGVSKC